jgi:hypothetical protein
LPRRRATPGPAVEPGVPAAIATPIAFHWAPPAAEAKTSGRRLAFAQWLTQPYHPLTARVIANRIWFHHFGEGIVATPDDFGMLGAPPSHPQLLDWLALDLVEHAWSLKHLHRRILTSSTYRQQSAHDPSENALAIQVDPDNRLLWRHVCDEWMPSPCATRCWRPRVCSTHDCSAHRFQ